jgi:hypothetical protein
MEMYQDILNRISKRPGFMLNNHTDTYIRSNNEERKHFLDRIREFKKEHQIKNSTNIVTWAILEAIETTKENDEN